MDTEVMGKRCGFCKGSKKVKKSVFGITMVSCPICSGTGLVYVPDNYAICVECGGRGKKLAGYAMTGATTCETCEGKGWAKSAYANND